MVTAQPLGSQQTVRAVCMLTDQIGDCVYVRGPMNGSYKVARADPLAITKMPAVGVIIAKWGYTDCLVRMSGEAKVIYSGLQPGRSYVVGVSGRPVLLSSITLAPGQELFIQVLGTALDSGVLHVQPASISGARSS